MKTVYLFPGQGAQTVGMGKDIAEAYDCALALYQKANEIVGYDLAAICFEGPEEKLNKTTVSQPAIFVTSAAILEVLKENGFVSNCPADVTAGLSLGEYTALYAAGIVSFEQGLELVQKRGDTMQQAADESDGSMVSILGLDEQQVAELCQQAAQGQLLSPANFNCPGQIVVSGARDACRRVAELAPQRGAMKAVELTVAGAFHTAMMQPAADALAQALQDCDMNVPQTPRVIANVDTEYYSNADQVRQGLSRQLTQPILWQKSMEKLLAEGGEQFYEIGPGRVLTGLMKRIHRRTKVNNVSNLASVQSLLGELAA